MSTFGAKLVTFRRRLGMTQRTLAARANLHPSQVSRMEKGKENPPGVEKLLLLVDALHLRPMEAVELVESAGYSSQILQAGAGLGIPAPPISEPYATLQTVLARLRPEQQQQCIDAFVALVEALSPTDPNLPRGPGEHE